MEVWFQRSNDIVRKLLSGDLDLGIVGLDTLSEYGQVRESEGVGGFFPANVLACGRDGHHDRHL